MSERRANQDKALHNALVAEGWGVFPVTHRSLVRPRVRRDVFLSLLMTFGQGFQPTFVRIRRRVLH